MLDRTIVLWTIAACMSAIPVAAQAPAPTTTAFDGTYVGVSRTVEGFVVSPPGAGPTGQRASSGGNPENDGFSCMWNGQPGPLTIANGVARYSGRVGWPEASVNAQGVLVMRRPDGGRLDALIDERGTMTGRIWTGGGCSYHMVWQKEGK
jgi:hypothetical protein